MKFDVKITIDASSSYVSESDIATHINGIANDIKNYAEGLSYEDYYRKVSPDWDIEEDAHLSITVEVAEAP